MSRLACLAIALLALPLLPACGGAPQGPRVRFAHASPQELAAAEQEPVVWYEFLPGDEVPLMFAFVGMGEAGSDNLRMVVRRQFWIVVFEDGQTAFSFDGQTLQYDPFSRWGLLVAGEENRGKLGLIMYVGTYDEAPAELR